MKKLKRILAKQSGRDFSGRVRVRHQGGRQKRFYRVVDWKRDKKDVWAQVVAIEFDPNRNAYLAAVKYEDGELRYVLAPLGIEVGSKLISSEVAPIESGNHLPLSKIPVGTQVHNIEIRPGKGGQIVKGAGSVAVIQGKETDYVLLKLPSGEVRRFVNNCWATVGQVGNIEARSVRIPNAGTKRRMGIRPTVRGTAQHPNSHPHGGGEGRSGIGLKHPKTPWGKSAVGKTRNKRKYSNNLIIEHRKPARG
ncbi:MAG TPA: 50S ribosomal protein L2 [Patescibacteria group bacterium]|nr:50S ribosomal protein L2 [Patescibacteria group bacterium]